jgi:hypothetical protein
MGDLFLDDLRHSGSADPSSLALASVTKLVVHSVRGGVWLDPTFPELRALSCDADDYILSSLSDMVSLHTQHTGGSHVVTLATPLYYQ